MRKIKILMFGWELPPFNAGGLGVACEGLIKALVKKVNIIFVLPKKIPCPNLACQTIFAEEEEEIGSAASQTLLFSPYFSLRSVAGDQTKKSHQSYFDGLLAQVERYAKAAAKIALSYNFDLIHAHDWLTYPAACEAKRISRKPLIAHVHATEFDRAGGFISPQIYEIERQGLEAADLIITVSNFTKQKIINHYYINPQKIKVIHNAISADAAASDLPLREHIGLNQKNKIVLFVGRLTVQKGPDYFLLAAKRVLEHNPDVFFVIVGAGEMEAQVINQAAQLGIADKVVFTGFLRGYDLERIFRAADLFVLSSISEPFGLTALESLCNGTPVLISKQSGAAEALQHCLKVDFWDTNQMADKILAVLEHNVLQKSLSENGFREVKKFTWDDA
ncbi:MAG: glycosyltransferase family 4 protein, partial [Patescibacteria group bacterium]